MSVRYLDTGLNGQQGAIGPWLERELAAEPRSFRGQFGFFDGRVLATFLPEFTAMVQRGGDFRMVMGANPGDPACKEDLESMLPLLADPQRASLTVVAFGDGALFHPKAMHIVRQDGSAVALVGSANFTSKGFGHSVEAGVLLEASGDTNDAIKHVSAAIDHWAVRTDAGVYQITCRDDIEGLANQSLAVSRVAKARARRQATSTNNTGTRGKSKVLWRPSTEIQDTAGHEEAVAELHDAAAETQPTTNNAFELVWISKPLKRRDLAIPKAKGSHPTGSKNLGKGVWPKDKDQRHYFRDEVFHALDWQPTQKKKIELADASFELVVDGKAIGEFKLEIAHNSSTVSATYLQRNSTTALRWGSAKPHVAQEEHLGKTMFLSRMTNDHARFRLEIRPADDQPSV